MSDVKTIQAILDELYCIPEKVRLNNPEFEEIIVRKIGDLFPGKKPTKVKGLTKEDFLLLLSKGNVTRQDICKHFDISDGTAKYWLEKLILCGEVICSVNQKPFIYGLR